MAVIDAFTLYGQLMMTSAVSASRLRAAALAFGGVAVSAMVIVGCSKSVEGSSTVDEPGAAAFRTSVSLSAAASASSSSSSASVAATQAACQVFVDTGKPAMQAVNAYVDAENAGGTDAAKLQAAVDALHHAADAVTKAAPTVQSPALKTALGGWAGAAQTLATAISTNASTSDFNAAVDSFNEAKSATETACE
ncbi:MULTISPECIES: hypothetical protein [Mycolicibacterium]|nr:MULTISPECIES: hypothetical protein [Mycolicibacterium]